ncbi:hypothetical protein BV20DRAFT_403671 [Pilatotrama ljubarskyi]|nr:hypothetical protein BV20DRAFT_403671 [Pilatotrama ljubarskyi]
MIVRVADYHPRRSQSRGIRSRVCTRLRTRTTASRSVLIAVTTLFCAACPGRRTMDVWLAVRVYMGTSRGERGELECTGAVSGVCDRRRVTVRVTGAPVAWLAGSTCVSLLSRNSGHRAGRGTGMRLAVALWAWPLRLQWRMRRRRSQGQGVGGVEEAGSARKNGGRQGVTGSWSKYGRCARRASCLSLPFPIVLLGSLPAMARLLP